MIQKRSLITTFRYCSKCKTATEHNILDGRIVCGICGRNIITTRFLTKLASFWRCWR